VFATWFGAETCVGSAGRVYAGGLSASSADPFGYALCLLLFALVFAIPLWKRKLTTIADLFRTRCRA
jgi:Na+/proline symporter